MLDWSAASERGGELRRWLWFAVVVSLALDIFLIVTHGVLPKLDLRDPSVSYGDTGLYLSMVAHRWSLGAWTLQSVPVPFRYRILVPWLARQLPFEPVLAMALVNWASVAGANVFLILTCRRLGLSRMASACGLVVAFTFYSSSTFYLNPLMTDGFILLVLSAMTYAFVIDAFWMFALWGLVGSFAREVPLALLPVWCVRDLKRGAAVTAIGGIAMIATRVSLMETSGPTWGMLQPSWFFEQVAHFVRKGPPGATFWPRPLSRRFFNDIAYCWGWAFAFAPVGLVILPRDSWSRLAPFAAALFVAAFGMSIVATDISREFLVLLPVMVISAAALVDVLASQQHIVWLALFLGLAAVQFSLSAPNVVFDERMWATLSVRVPLIKIGAVWTLGTAILLRRELVVALRDTQRWISGAFSAGDSAAA